MKTSAVFPLVINVFALMILIILLVDFLRKQSSGLTSGQRIFKWMLVTNILILVVDTFTYLSVGFDYATANIIATISQTVFYAINPIMSILYICYCDAKLGVPGKTRQTLMLFYLIPFTANLVLSVLTPAFGFYFFIDEVNNYHRGDLFLWSYILSYILLLVAFIRVAVHSIVARRGGANAFQGETGRTTLALLMFPIPPVIGGLIQLVVNFATFVWLATVISLLIIYINIQNSEISTDLLTGLSNRRHIMNYLERCAPTTKNGDKSYLILLDIDGFKQFNDSLGHAVGDEALKVVAHTLLRCCSKEDLVSRYGGDEFIIVTARKSREDIDSLIGRINRDLATNSFTAKCGRTLSVCAGYAEWPPDSVDADALISAADAELYKSKAKLRRRSGDR